MTRREHLLDIYGVRVHLATTARQVAALNRRFEGTLDDLDPAAMGATSSVLDTSTEGRNGFHVVIYVDADRHAGDPGRLIDTIAHESCHAAGMILAHLGALLDPREEHVAYLLGWLSGWVWDNL